MKHARHGCTLALALFAAWHAAHADLRVRVEESVNGAPPAPVTHWFGDQRAMRDDGNRYIITRLDQDMSYVVNRQTRSYREVKLKLENNSDLPAVTVKRSDDVRHIAGWKARRYRLSGPATRNLTIDIWVTRELKTDVAPFRRLMIALGNRPGSEWLKAYRTIKGFPVLQQVTLKHAGITLHSNSRVVSVTQATPPPNTYTPPDDYSRVR